MQSGAGEPPTASGLGEGKVPVGEGVGATVGAGVGLAVAGAALSGWEGVGALDRVALGPGDVAGPEQATAMATARSHLVLPAAD